MRSRQEAASAASWFALSERVMELLRGQASVSLTEPARTLLRTAGWQVFFVPDPADRNPVKPGTGLDGGVSSLRAG